MPLFDPSDLELITLRALADFSGCRVVEIGAGDGRLSEALAAAAAQWLALEPDAAELAMAAQALRDQAAPVRLLASDGRALALPAAHFDLAFFTWSLC
jgi:16S rRNA A1518/A1519 N6-dimethyltransferase RsmA/KsgA/DIM1 with predicted DNA glycosylase/AP lyase activity